MTQISGSERAHQTTGDASEGGNLPDRARLSRLPARRVVDHAARIGRPAWTIVIHIVFGESERRSASQQPHPDLTRASGDGDERDRPAVGRQCWRFLESDEIGQSLQLHGPRRGARLDDRTQHPTRSGCEHQTGDSEQPCHRPPHRSTSDNGWRRRGVQRHLPTTSSRQPPQIHHQLAHRLIAIGRILFERFLDNELQRERRGASQGLWRRMTDRVQHVGYGASR